MHEIGLCQELVAAARRRAAGRPVNTVRVRVGVLHRVDEPSMDQAFEMLTCDTELAGARLETVVIPVSITCASCSRVSSAHGALPACPACGALDPAISGGDELMLESIEMRAAAPTGSAA